MSGWTPVTRMMPPLSRHVLWCAADADAPTPVSGSEYEIDRCAGVPSGRTVVTDCGFVATHWQTLPELPEESAS